jgi:tetratricopeptide (TPR) repeat protein
MIRNPKIQIFSSIVFTLLAGCLNPVNRYTAGKYYDMGVQAERNGDLEAAREAYRRATLNVDWGNVGPGAKAQTLYEYARVSGYLCYHEEAEKYFKESLTLQEKDAEVQKSLRPPTLLELSRFYFDTGRKKEALPFYEEGIALVRPLSPEKNFPIEFATTLEEYADCLTVVGRNKEAEESKGEAKSIRSAYKGPANDHPFQRYNERCGK